MSSSANNHQEEEPFDYEAAYKELEELKRDMDENQRIIKRSKELDEEIANLENTKKPSFYEMDEETRIKHIQAVFGEQAGDFLKHLGEVNASNVRVEEIANNIIKSMEQDNTMNVDNDEK